MAQLVPYDAKNITANYSSAAKTFSVTANALLPLPFVSAEFKRQTGLQGGRQFRLEGVPSGLGGQQQVMMLKPYIETNMVDPPRLSSVSVALKDPVTKTETTVSIPATIDAPTPSATATPAVASTTAATSTSAAAPVPLKPQPMPVLPTKSDPSALKAIDIALPAQNFVRITAPLPDAAGPRTSVDGRSEGDATYTWRAGQLPGLLYWDVAWAGNGAGVGKGATFTVTTTVTKTSPTSNGTSSAAPNTNNQVTVQPYAIKLPTGKNNNLVDLFDPDA